MRPDYTQSQPVPAPRPIQRPVAGSMPVQRGNYGVPPRQRPTVDSFTRPAPVAVAPVSQSMPTAQPTAAPVASTAMSPQAPGRFMDVQPAQSTVPQPQAQPTPSLVATQPAVDAQTTPTKRRRLAILPKLRIALLVVGGLLVIAGAARWVTAGSTSGDTIAVGAVKANDSTSVTIQFTADDGRLHYLTLKGSHSSLIPGTAVQVAYQPGAADKTAVPVTKVTSARSLGTSLLGTGIGLLIVGAFLYAWKTWRHRKPVAAVQQARPVTA